MTQSGTATIAAVSETAPRSIDVPELIDRLAERLRCSSDVDLPHSYFVEQVRLGLGGTNLTDQMVANDIEGPGRKQQRTAAQSVFHAWAMPD
ncbi:hypothetical protein [Rhizobium sp. CECT 9324]|uniref:hypothetical protein n=1 Tax=Rhizobium sp. CECT 9324 TaxID=2845820 RepID=UPI000DDD35E6|nr:hypothetical protein [Rhizobium sp. CECT 9324]CAH0341449.1 hypothetical protein RHI9324_03144 [Rhizobium sp. CECT 9324]